MQFEDYQKSLSVQYQDAQKRLQEDKMKATELGKQLLLACNELDARQQELVDFKEKANFLLHSKERHIASLQGAAMGSTGAAGGQGMRGQGMGQGGVEAVPLSEYEVVRRERDQFREDSRQARMAFDNIKSDLHELELHMYSEKETLQVRAFWGTPYSHLFSRFQLGE